MAILKMKKLRLAVVRKEKPKLLRELIKLGCVQFVVLDDKLSGSELENLLSREGSSLLSFKSKLASLQNAVAILDKYVPVKSPLLSSPPEFEIDSLLDEGGLNGYVMLASKLEESEERVRHINTEESRRRALIDSAEPWMPLELPLSFEGTERSACLIGTLPARGGIEKTVEALAELTPEAELFEISRDSKLIYVLAVCMKEEFSAVQDCLREHGFAAVSNGITGSARDCTSESKAVLAELELEKKGCIEYIKSEAIRRDEYKLAADKMSAKISMAEAEEKCFGSESFVLMAGWVPAEKEKKLDEIFSRFNCAWDTEDPEEEEYPAVPVKLKSNAFTDSMNMVTNMYSLPLYGTVDPNPIMAPFFILIYGLMMADMGYGLIMVLAAIVAMKRIKPREGALTFCRLLLYCGISTIAMGALTGGFFGDIPKQLYDIICAQKGIEPVWQGLPSLFSPTEDSTLVLAVSMLIGFLHMNAGMAVSFALKWRAGDKAAAIWEEGSLWALFLTGGLYALSSMGILPLPSTLCLALLVAALLMLLFGAGRDAKGIGKFTAALGCVYNTATGWFGDILSYSRIMALMLAGGVVGQVFNTVALMPAKNGLNVLSGIAFVIIFLLGHAMNFALNLLGCYVHNLRLQCLEFFGKFYTDGGRPFAPLKFNGRYVREKI